MSVTPWTRPRRRSQSTTKVRSPWEAKAQPILQAIVVFPSPGRALVTMITCGAPLGLVLRTMALRIRRKFSRSALGTRDPITGERLISFNNAGSVSGISPMPESSILDSNSLRSMMELSSFISMKGKPKASPMPSNSPREPLLDLLGETGISSRMLRNPRSSIRTSLSSTLICMVSKDLARLS